MRFGILTQYYPPEIGAPQARLSELAARLDERGHEVTVLTAMPNYPLGRIFNGYSGVCRREEIGGIRLIRATLYATKSLGVKRLLSYGSFVLSSALFGSVLLPRLDFLLTESPSLFLGISGYWLSRLKRVRWIFNVADLWPESAVRLGVARPGMQLSAAYALEAFCYRRAWMVSGQSKEILSNIRTRFPAVETWHLSNGVTPELFSPDARSPEARAQLARGQLAGGKPGSDECIAVYAGLHGIAQGLDQVLEAAALLRNFPGLRFVFIGDGPDKSRLRAIAHEQALTNVTFLDPVPRSAMPALLASADLAIVPLRNLIPGAVPSKIYEAMASAVPVVLAASGEAAEIIQRTCSGAVVPPGDIPRLAAAIRLLAADPGLRRKLGEAGRHAALTQFHRRLILDRFIDRLEWELASSSDRAAFAAATGSPKIS